MKSLDFLDFRMNFPIWIPSTMNGKPRGAPVPGSFSFIYLEKILELLVSDVIFSVVSLLSTIMMLSCVQVEGGFVDVVSQIIGKWQGACFFLFNLKVLWSNRLIVNWFVYMYICDILMFFIPIYI